MGLAGRIGVCEAEGNSEQKEQHARRCGCCKETPGICTARGGGLRVTEVVWLGCGIRAGGKVGRDLGRVRRQGESEQRPGSKRPALVAVSATEPRGDLLRGIVAAAADCYKPPSTGSGRSGVRLLPAAVEAEPRRAPHTCPIRRSSARPHRKSPTRRPPASCSGSLN